MTRDTATELAYTRTHLANQRTYASWLRTGLAVSAGGYAVGRIGTEDGDRLLLAVGVALVLAGSAIIMFGAWSFRRVAVSLASAGVADGLSRRLTGGFSLLLSVLLVIVAFIL